ncbi:unnamed protein product [Symbiodinium sp. CCMP2592]|nr:unnamed protein product [Symbiodinium sp. CCMP2592]
MAHFFLMQGKMDEVAKKFFAVTQEANDALPSEVAAVTKIQSVHRAPHPADDPRMSGKETSQVGEHRAYKQAAATLLPPLCLVLRRLSLLLSVDEHKAKAAMIQRLWRGWFSRLHVHDFYMRRDYLVKARYTVPPALAGPSSECFRSIQVEQRGQWTQDFLASEHKDGWSAEGGRRHHRCRKEKLQVAKMEEELKVRQELLGTKALAAARRTGWVPVVGLLSTDQMTDLIDAGHAASQLMVGMVQGSTMETAAEVAAEAAGGTGGTDSMPFVPTPIPEGDEDDEVLMSQPVVVDTAGVGSPPVASPVAAAPTPMATAPTPSGRSTPAIVKATPPEDLAPLPSAPPSVPASGTATPAPQDYFIDVATKAKAASLLASRADTWQVAALTSMPSSGTATPAHSARRGPPNAREIVAALDVQATQARPDSSSASAGRRPFFTGLDAMEEASAAASGAASPTGSSRHKAPPTPLVPPTALVIDPNRGGGTAATPIHPGLGIAAVTVPAENLETAEPMVYPPTPNPYDGPPTHMAAAASAAEVPMTLPTAARRIAAAASNQEFPYIRRPPADAHHRRSSVPTEAMRAERRRREASAHERRQYEAYDPRRWGSTPWTAEEVGHISPAYFEYKRLMERAGASAEETAVPPHLRRFAYASLGQLREMEDSGALPRPATPRRGEDPPEADYPFLRRLPAGVAGARITVRHSKEERRIVGWCAHPCTVPHRDAVCGGEGRCLRPIALGAAGAHGASGSHKCPACEGLKGTGRR